MPLWDVDAVAGRAADLGPPRTTRRSTRAPPSAPCRR